MPAEILTYQEVSQFMKGGDLKLIDHKHELGGHTTTWYKIVIQADPANPYRRCDRFQSCGKAAQFMLKERDHWGKEWVNLFCDSHASDNLQRKWEEVIAGGTA